MSIKIIRLTESEAEFVIGGIDDTRANAIRRSIKNDVATMAASDCFIHVNTSQVEDEQLAHRLAMSPVRADPRGFRRNDQEEGPDTVIKFKLKETCGPHDRPRVVTTGHLQWVPQQGQKPAVFAHDNIELAELHPNQTIDADVHCIKGTGQQHAKWCPVSAVAMENIEPGAYRIRFRTVGSRSAHDVVTEAFDRLIANTQRFITQVADAPHT